VESLLQDIRFGLKLLARDRAFTMTAVLTLAVCIGANAMVFSVLNSMVLRPLPVPESDRLILMGNSYPGAGAPEGTNSGVPDYFDRRNGVSAFEEQALVDVIGASVTSDNVPLRVTAMIATPSLFPLLRVPARLGRWFTEDEGEIGRERKVILSYAAWQQIFGGEASAIGRDLRINGEAYEVVGVMPRGFLFMDPEVRLWIPLAFTAQQKSDQARHSNNYSNIGRLKPGATIEQARAQVDAINKANLDRFPEMREILINAGFHTRLFPLKDVIVRDIAGPLYMLWGGALLVLLIGCVNIANLSLVRASARLRELATRVALGAGRWRIARQLLTESVVLTLAGAALGIALGYWGLSLAAAPLGLDRHPRGAEIRMDAAVVTYALGLAALAGAFVALVAVASVGRTDLATLFREDQRTGSGGRRTRFVRHALVVAQVGLALMLLVGAGLLLASFRRVLEIDPGFRPGGVLTARVALVGGRYEEEATRQAFVRQALDQIRALPGVAAAGVASAVPFDGNSSDSVILAEGHVMAPGESLVSPSMWRVSPGYMEALGARLIAGRLFDSRDTETSQRVIIIDDRLARKFWPDQDPIGRRMWFPTSAEDLTRPPETINWITVVGVIQEVRSRDLVTGDQRLGAYYLLHAQFFSRTLTFTIRTAGNPHDLIALARREMATLDADLPLYDIRTMEERMAEALDIRRSPMLLATIFAGVALFLAAIGIYGVLAYLVAQRRKELGIRIALGSGARGVFTLVLSEGLRLAGAGFVLGLAGAALLGRAMRSQLYGVGAFDPVVILITVAVLGLVALLACVVPAGRATRIEPLAVLNRE
jgi:predicted permease